MRKNFRMRPGFRVNVLGTNEQVAAAIEEWRRRNKRRVVQESPYTGMPFVAYVSSLGPRALVIERSYYLSEYPSVSAAQLARGDVPQAWVKMPGGTWHVKYLHGENALMIGCKKIDLCVAAKAIKSVRAALAASKVTRTRYADLNGAQIATGSKSVTLDLGMYRLDESQLDAVERVIEMAVEARDYANANKKRK